MLVPVALAQKLLEADVLAAGLLAFLAFSLADASVYLVNDLLDLQDDRSHPSKRHRPLASGLVPLRHALPLAPALFLAAVLVALALPRLFLAILAIYIAGTFAYSLFLKRMLLFDVLALTGL